MGDRVIKMTPEERLSQTEKLLETAARYIDRHSQAIEQNTTEIRELRASLSNVLGLFSELAAYQRQHQEEMSIQREEIRLHREEIRSNQAEIRRIWEYLLDRQGNGRSGN
jgi:Fic family protein